MYVKIITQQEARGFDKRRKIAMIVAVILALAILFTGTFAWQSISQQAMNQAVVAPSAAGGRLHDDFEVMGENYGMHEWATGLRANKDIYVENFEGAEGSATAGRNIFARVRLYEYMEFGEGAHLSPDDPEFDDRAAEPVVPGARRIHPDTRLPDVETWSPRVPDWSSDDDAVAISDLFRNYWSWDMGGQKWYMPTFNRDHYSLESDVKGDAIDPQPLQPGESRNSTFRNPDELHYFPPQAGLHDFFDPANPAGISAFSPGNDNVWYAQRKFWDPTLGATGGHNMTTFAVPQTSRETLDADIMYMHEWMELDNDDDRITNAWVIDEDGWAYWAQPIQQNSATGLLLDGIRLVSDVDEEMYYGIFAYAQMATADEWMESSTNGGWFFDSSRAPSDDASYLMALITGNLIEVVNARGELLVRRPPSGLDNFANLGNGFRWNPETRRVEGFGRYLQGSSGGGVANNTFDEDPLNWILLDLDLENGGALLITEYLVDNVMWNLNSTDENDYQDSNLRRWLNSMPGGVCRGTAEDGNQQSDGFLNTAFTVAEQSRILPTNILSPFEELMATVWIGTDISPTGWSNAAFLPANAVDGDLVFTLSAAEVWRHFGPSVSAYQNGALHPENRTNAKTPITDYAYAKGGFRSAVDWTAGNGLWWTRSAGAFNNRVIDVHADGNLHAGGVITSETRAVRPAIWVDTVGE